MAGIYVHIPFCRQACHYCNFHFSTRLENTNELVAAIVREAGMRRQFLQNKPINSLYLGGGTPSVLPPAELNYLLSALYDVFNIAADAEVTLESNPDDLTAERLKALRDSPVNRLSIGIQSFRDQDLKWMNRAHNADEATRCLDFALAAGFDQLTVDLIYGSPGLDDAAWLQNLRTVFDRQLPHLSAYALTVEEGTALAHFVRHGKSPSPDEAAAGRHFSILEEEAARAGYTHYEISNLCRGGAFARHNSSYWTGQPYLGLGPSAHSFDGSNSSWNISHNIEYSRSVKADKLPIQGEHLEPADRLNERLMTGLRTTWGVELAALESQFGARAVEAIREQASTWMTGNYLAEREGHWYLTSLGRPFADRIASDLFMVDEQVEWVVEGPSPGQSTQVSERRAWWSEEAPG